MCKPDIMFPNVLKEQNMKLIKEIGMKLTPNGKHKRRYNLYQCPQCEKTFELKTTHVGKSCYSCSRKTANKSHGMFHTRQYKIWAAMWTRTTNKNTKNYEFYKDKKPPEKWRSFEAFWEDMKEGYGDNLEIDRKDNELPYSKENCRWATRTTQNRNTRLLRKSNTTGYRGIRKASSGRWVARISHMNKLIHIGTYDTDILAARAYDNYVISNKLEHTINFTKEVA